MSIWRQITHGFRALTSRSRADRDIADEVQHYLEQARAAHVALGLSPDAALRAARLELGNMTSVTEQVRQYGWENPGRDAALRLALCGQTPAKHAGIHDDRRAHPRARHRSHDRNLQRSESDPSRAVAVPRRASDRRDRGAGQQRVAQQRQLRHVSRAVGALSLVREHGGAQVMAANDHRRRSPGASRGTARQRTVLPCVWCIAGIWPRLSAVRRSAQWSEGGSPQRRALASPVRRRQLDRRAHRHARREQL